MSNSEKSLVILIAMLISNSMAFSQIPVELFGGNKKATLDIMFFKNFKSTRKGNSKFLFFNRNRASIDYRMTSTAHLPQFGFTEAISYNLPKLKGLAPVMVGQILNSGIFPKAGIQFARMKKEFTVFTWAVAETKANPMIDIFLLTRYTPRLAGRLQFFGQLELLNSIPSSKKNNITFIQRSRIGIKWKELQLGAAADFNMTGRGSFSFTQNIGGFVRYEY